MVASSVTAINSTITRTLLSSVTQDLIGMTIHSTPPIKFDDDILPISGGLAQEEFFGSYYSFNAVALLRRPVGERPENTVLTSRNLRFPGGLLQSRDNVHLNMACFMDRHIIIQFEIQAREGGPSKGNASFGHVLTELQLLSFSSLKTASTSD